MASNRNTTPPPYHKYINEVFVQHNNSLETIKNSLTEQESLMQLSPAEARLLQVIIAMIKPKKVVEIGVLAGYSAIHIAQSMPQNGHIWALDRSPRCVKLATKHFQDFGVADRITLLEGEASDNLKEIEQHGPFDMVFIDADKIAYPQYLDWAEKNTQSGSVIIGDNTFLFGSVYHESPPKGIAPTTWEAMRSFNKRLGDDRYYTSVLIPTIEGMTVAVKK
tara:strand:- start:264 stop:926 length:663 start_codon:yes stop_codon:yes gene_type:complete